MTLNIRTNSVSNY